MKKKDALYILNEISDFFTLVQLMDSLGNMNQTISIVGYWIFESNYEQEIFTKR